MRVLTPILCTLFLMGCGPNQGSIPVQIVAPIDNEMTRYGLRVATLQRMSDFSQLKGERFIFRAGRNVPWSEYAVASENQDSFESVRSTLSKKLALDPVSPRFSWNGDFYGAADFDSLYMATAYYWFERVADFFQDTVKDTSVATHIPVVVSVYGAFTSKGFVKVPTGFADNSAYQPLEDIFRMYRVGDQEGVPFEMNPGVIAHEFQHRVFHKLVFETKGKEGYRLWKTFSSTNSSLKLARPRALLRATDEGMADIHALAFSRNPNFLAVSQPHSDSSREEQRNLESEFAKVATYDNLADSSIEAQFLNDCNGESLNYANPSWRFYCLGTVIAKTIWDASGNDVDVLRLHYLPVLNRCFAALGDALLADFANYDVDVFWRILLPKLDADARLPLCANIKLRFQSLYSRIPECV